MPIDINLGRIAAYVRLDFSKLEGDKRKAQKSIKDFAGKLTKEVGESFSSLGQKMSLGITAPLLALGKGAVDAATKLDSLKRGLRAVSGSSEETERQLKRLREVAKLPGLSFEQAVEGATRLQAAGFSAQLAERSLKAFGNALATVGKGSAELSGVNLALSQISAKGKVSAEEINQIAERVPQIRRIMQSVFGTADTEVLQRAKITSAQFIQAIVGELEKLPKVTGGVQNSFENFSDSMRAALAELGQAILPDLIKAMKQIEEGVKSFIGWWKQLPDATRQNIIHFAEFVALIGPMTLLIGSVAGAVGNLTAAFAALKTATIFLRTPGGLIGAGVVGAGAIIAKVINDLNNSISQGNKRMFEADRRERTSHPREYWEKQISEARQRMEFARTNPLNNANQRADQMAANQRMIANAERQLKSDIAGKMFGPPAPRITAQEMAQEALKKQLRAQIDAGSREAAARKAEIAQRKAEAERRRNQSRIDRARRVVVGRNTAEVNLFAGNEAAGRKSFDAWLADMAEAAEAAWKADFKAMGRDMATNMQNIGENMLSDVARRGRQATQAGRMKKMMGATSGFLGGASDALSNAMGMFSPLAEKAAQETAARQTALTEKIVQHNYRMGYLSLQQYQMFLEQRLQAVRGNVEEEMRIESELQQVKFGLLEEQERKRYQGWQNLARGLEGVFANAFNDVLSGSKDFFQSLLDGFKQMLAAMLAQALAAGLMRALFGGGNFLTGFLSVFGFDSGANDAKAHRWGRDFSRHFASGAMEQSRTRAMQGAGRMSSAGASGGNISVNLSIGNFNNYTDADADRLSQQIAMGVRNRLRQKV